MIGKFFGRRVAEGRVPGAAWSVTGRESAGDCGVVGAAQLRPTVEPLDRMTPFDLASLTKPLATALLLLIAARRDELHVEDLAQRWIPEWAGTRRAQVTLLQLATHEAGLQAWVPLGRVLELPKPSDRFPAAPERRRDRIQRALRHIASLPSLPGAADAVYSDLGYIALGAAIERACGQTLDRLFEERIAGPLGLRHSGYPDAQRRFERAAASEEGNRFERALAGEEGATIAFREAIPRGEVHDGNAFLLGGVAGHAGLFGTVDDVARLARAILQPDSSLGLGSVERDLLLLPGLGGLRTCGFELARSNRAARGILADDAPGHLGFTGTSVWIEPGSGGVAVLLSHRVHPRIGCTDFQAVRRAFHRLAVRSWRARR